MILTFNNLETFFKHFIEKKIKIYFVVVIIILSFFFKKKVCLIQLYKTIFLLQKILQSYDSYTKTLQFFVQSFDNYTKTLQFFVTKDIKGKNMCQMIKLRLSCVFGGHQLS